MMAICDFDTIYLWRDIISIQLNMSQFDIWLTDVPCFSRGLACLGGSDIFQWKRHSQSYKYSCKDRKSYSHTYIGLKKT